MLHFVLGGARSGKSRYAESQAALCHEQTGQVVTYMATAQSLDSEMQARITQHQNDRPDAWLTREEPLNVSDALADFSAKDIVILDCLTLWLMNVLDSERALQPCVDELLVALNSTPADVFIVSNEITLGVVPMGALSRKYVDELGRLHQRVAAQADKVTLMVAGIPLSVKSS